MSRSRRHNPFLKIAGSSDKKDKRIANRKFRRIERVKVNIDEIPPSHIREVSDTWSFNSDGLAFRLRCADSKKEEDLQRLKKFMRK